MVVDFDVKKTRPANGQTDEEAVKRNRTRMRQIIRDYKEWSARINAERGEQERRYLSYEGMFLRNHFKDGWTLYKTVSRDYHNTLKLNNKRHNKAA